MGSAENLDKANIQILIAKKDIPVPTSTNFADTHSRSDIIIATPDLSQTALTYTHITIVEIKYTRYTSIDAQLEKALPTHPTPNILPQQIPRLPGQDPTHHTTNLRCNIYNPHCLSSRLLRDKTLTQLLRQLHTHAITSLHEIVTFHRQLERRQHRRTNHTTAIHGKLDPD